MAEIVEECGRNQKIVRYILGTQTSISVTNHFSSSVAMLNYLPIAGQAIQLVAELLFSGFSDYLGVRLPFLLLHSVCHKLPKNLPSNLMINVGHKRHIPHHPNHSSQ